MLSTAQPTCFLIADMARRLVSERAAKVAFLLAAVCPFLASYAAAALTETLEIFFTALAIDCAIAGLQKLDEKRLRPWLGCGLAIGAAILCVGPCLEREVADESPEATRFVSLIASWADCRCRIFGAAGSVGWAQSAHHASLRTAGAALRQ